MEFAGFLGFLVFAIVCWAVYRHFADPKEKDSGGSKGGPGTTRKVK